MRVIPPILRSVECCEPCAAINKLIVEIFQSRSMYGKSNEYIAMYALLQLIFNVSTMDDIVMMIIANDAWFSS